MRPAFANFILKSGIGSQVTPMEKFVAARRRDQAREPRALPNLAASR